MCKSRARNDVVWDVGPGSYTTSYLGPSHDNVIFAGPYHRADTTEVLLKNFSTFRETVPKAWHLPTEVSGGGGYHRAGMWGPPCGDRSEEGTPPWNKTVAKTYRTMISN